jgi:formylglycine-generating enzyme required for sulfatase activity
MDDACKIVNTCRISDLKQVTLKPFYIDAMPVTNALLQKCVSDGKCTQTQYLENAATVFSADSSRPNVPAVVSYVLAEEYCASIGKSLPTEEQWLAAAMGNKIQKYSWGDDDLLTATVQIPLYDFSKLEDVGSMPTDQFNGIYDMSGNGYEWIKADIIKAYIPENAACDEPDSRPCMGGVPLPLYQKIGIYANTPATFRCVKPAK